MAAGGAESQTQKKPRKRSGGGKTNRRRCSRKVQKKTGLRRLLSGPDRRPHKYWMIKRSFSLCRQLVSVSRTKRRPLKRSNPGICIQASPSTLFSGKYVDQLRLSRKSLVWNPFHVDFIPDLCDVCEKRGLPPAIDLSR